VGMLCSTDSRVGESVTLMVICSGVCKKIWVCYVVWTVGLVSW